MGNQSVTVMCLLQTIQSGPLHYPLFVGFISAEQIAEIAEAPSFHKDTTTNKDIADNILNQPINDWQRPIEEERVARIADVFGQPGEFMPNPVLLAQNVVSSSVKPDIVAQPGVGVTLHRIEIPIPAEGAPKPLWILDGQHRIAGLSRSLQRSNPIPVVLMLDQTGHMYTGRVLAKIFAQVTTEATKLHKFHNEWLTYAFELDKYSSVNSHSADHKKAMECVAKLCRLQNVGPGNILPNAFCNQIQFHPNPDRAPAPPPGGFYYDCVEFASKIFKFYYNRSNTQQQLNPDELAEQIAMAHGALAQVVPQPHDKSVFFGKSDHYQQIMADAFLAGVLEYLREVGRPNDWASILRILKFDQTNWNFNWVVSLAGQANETSKKIATDVFTKSFREVSLPNQTSNLADYLRGDQAKIQVLCSEVASNGKVLKTNTIQIDLMSGSIVSQQITPRTHIRIVNSSPNIGKVVAYDKQKPGFSPRYPELQKKGLTISSSEHSNPIELQFQFHHYGNNTRNADISLTWV
jgi:DGQHR domain-containing protein